MEGQHCLYHNSSGHLDNALNFLPHPDGVGIPALTTSFQLFLKAYVQSTVCIFSWILPIFLVSKELLLRLQSLQSGNYPF